MVVLRDVQKMRLDALGWYDVTQDDMKLCHMEEWL